MEFRLLRADEIDCRISTVSQKGLTLLLYKDARCDQNILDETVGNMNWQRHHTRDNANCIVSIWDAEKQQWIEKEDTGTESYTEKEKGLASDSFKRACFNWGLGRELYTAPFMWVPAENCNIEQKGNGFTCYDRFVVQEIRYENRNIVYVRVFNTKKKTTMEYGTPVPRKISETKAKALEQLLTEANVNIPVLLQRYGVNSISDLTEDKHSRIVASVNKSR